MAKKKSIIIKELHENITSNGSRYYDWYVGTSKDPNENLYDHKVEADFPYQYKERAWSSEDARDIEEYFVRLLNTDGDPGGGDQSATWIYAYKNLKKAINAFETKLDLPNTELSSIVNLKKMRLWSGAECFERSLEDKKEQFYKEIPPLSGAQKQTLIKNAFWEEKK